MQLSLALAYKSDSEDPSGISKHCCAAFVLFLWGGVVGGKKNVICFWTASCSNQVDEIDSGCGRSHPRLFLGFVRGHKPKRKEAATLDFFWWQCHQVNISSEVPAVNLTLHEVADGGAHPRMPLPNSSGKEAHQKPFQSVFWPPLLSRSLARHCVRVGS